ncbi:biotin transporter BioY [Nocardioides sp. KR10-350]|uniref:biotin transporter BioY n=1 Tax=Nocardioides cheoyonin TaxID=3156615 RepID=UPI0032B4D41D
MSTMSEPTSPTADTTTPPSGTAGRRLSTTDLALVAAFAALVAVCSYVAAIPVGGAGVPITLQTFAILLAGALLGPLRGTLAVALYLLLGLAGLPVFAGHTSGPGPFTGASAGYLWSFPVIALVVGFLVRYVVGRRRTSALYVFLACAVGVLVNHAGGILGMSAVLHVSLAKAASFDAPFWLGDAIKAAVAAIVAAEVHRAFPALLRRG